MSEEQKKKAEDIDFEEIVETVEEKKEKKKGGFFNTLKMAGKAVLSYCKENPKQVAIGVGAVVVTGVTTHKITKKCEEKKAEKLARKAYNAGCTTGVYMSHIEHSKLPDEEKQRVYDETGHNREAYHKTAARAREDVQCRIEVLKSIEKEQKAN